jgi:hypothetical protein
VDEQLQTVEPTGSDTDLAADGAAVPPRRRQLSRRISHRPVVAAAVVVAVLLAATGWVAVRGRQAAGDLRAAATLLVTMRRQVASGDIPAARATLTALQKEARAAADRTGDPLWRAAATLPWVGDDLAAARTIALTVRDLSDNGLPPLLDAADAVTSGRLTPSSGTIDLGVLVGAGTSLTAGGDVVRRSAARVAGIPRDGLTDEVRDAVAQLDTGLATVAGVLGPAERAAALMPSILGGHVPRRYLVLFQNPAEVRATGGMPGAFAVIEAHRGEVSIVVQGTAAGDLKSFAEPVLPLDPDAEELYGSRLATFPADINLTPDFPTVAKLAREMYRARTGWLVDGVLATDPIAMSYLFKATGPVQMPTGGPLTADNAVRMLLSQVYAGATSSAAQDAYFATAARAAFEALTRRPGDPRGLATQLMRAVDERRVLFWSAAPEEQKAIEGTAVAGTLPADDGATPTVGVFLNDGSGAKLGYYLTQSVDVTTGACTDDGRRELRMRLTLGSTAPTTGLSPWVTGLGLAGDPYTVRTNVMVFSPAGGSVADATLDGAETPIGSGFERGRQVAVVTVDLPPATRKTLSVTLITAPLPTVDTPVTPALVTTPMVSPWRSTVGSGQPCQK